MLPAGEKFEGTRNPKGADVHEDATTYKRGFGILQMKLPRGGPATKAER